jgi:putative membrane protein
MATRNRNVWPVLVVLVLAVLLVPMLGGGIMGPGMMGAYGAGGWTWGLGMGLGWLAMLAFWGALVVGAVAAARWLGGTAAPGGTPASETPLEILRRRFAAGEIDREQYERMRQALER